MSRISQKFQELKQAKKTAFVSYICAGDPNYETSLEILKSMPKNGVDIIELGIPFLDPSGDGPIIQEAAKRAVANGISLKKTLQMAAEFRKTDEKTPVILMTYYNPVLKYGVDKIFLDAAKSGIDGFLIVDLPLEEEGEVINQIKLAKLDLINLIAPTTSQERAKNIIKNSSGFLYLISILGITGTKNSEAKNNQNQLEDLRKISDLPIIIGFGIKEAKQAKEFAEIGADGVVVGSKIVEEIDKNFLAKKSVAEIVENVAKKVQEFCLAVKS